MNRLLPLLLLVSGLVSSLNQLTAWESEIKLYELYFYEQSSDIEKDFSPIHTFPHIHERAEKLINSTLAMKANPVLEGMQKSKLKVGSLKELVSYNFKLCSFGMNSIRKLYLDNLRVIKLVQQTSRNRADEILLQFCFDHDFFYRVVDHSKTMKLVDSLATKAAATVLRDYIKALEHLDEICEIDQSILAHFKSNKK